MLQLIIRQMNWGIIGSLFGFVIGFLIKIYLIDIVGVSQWGKYVSAHAFATAFDTILSLGIPFILLKFLPDYLDKNSKAAKFLIRRVLIYAFKVSFIFIVLMYIFSPYIDEYIYIKIDDFSFILFLVAIHTPISIFTGIITSLYRSVLKIKELILYSVFIIVPLRAILTLFVFQYTDNIIYFVFIELLTGTLSLSVLFYLFNRREFSLSNIQSEVNDFEPGLFLYGKKIYANSLATFFGSQSLAIILSIMLPPSQIGVFSILLTITGVTLFLIQNLNKIFAPVISKLYSDGKIEELNHLYKRTTFIINFIAIPFSILIIYFSKQILLLYDDTGEILHYLPYLYILMGARIISLLAGSSGTLMIMAGLESKELLIQILKGILITLFSIFFIKEYGLFIIVILFLVFTLLVNVMQLFFINSKIRINPFSRNLFLLILLSLPMFYYAMNNDNEFNIYQLFWMPILVYTPYFLIFFSTIRSLYLDSIHHD